MSLEYLQPALAHRSTEPFLGLGEKIQLAKFFRYKGSTLEAPMLEVFTVQSSYHSKFLWRNFPTVEVPVHPDPAFHFDPDPDPAFQSNMDPDLTVWYGCGSLPLKEVMYLKRYFLYILTYLIFVVSRSNRTHTNVFFVNFFLSVNGSGSWKLIRIRNTLQNIQIRAVLGIRIRDLVDSAKSGSGIFTFRSGYISGDVNLRSECFQKIV